MTIYTSLFKKTINIYPERFVSQSFFLKYNPISDNAGFNRDDRIRNLTLDAVTSGNVNRRLKPIVVPSVAFFHSLLSQYSRTNFSTLCPTVMFS